MPCGHGWTCLRSATLGYDAVEQIDVCVEIEDWRRSAEVAWLEEGALRALLLTVYCNPFHDIHVLWQHDDGFEMALYERSLNEGATKVKWFRLLAH